MALKIETSVYKKDLQLNLVIGVFSFIQFTDVLRRAEVSQLIYNLVNRLSCLFLSMYPSMGTIRLHTPNILAL
jgi:hypothetical protein